MKRADVEIFSSKAWAAEKARDIVNNLPNAFHRFWENIPSLTF